MGVIYPNRTIKARRGRPSARRKSFLIAGIVVLGFAALNLVIAAVYHARTYPRATVAGAPLGNVAYGAIEERTAALTILPERITLQYEGKQASAALKDLGMRIDTQRTKDSLGTSRHWLPVVNLFIRHDLAAPAAFDDMTLQKYGEQLKPTFHQDPINAKLTLQNGTFAVKDGKNGYDLSISKLKPALLTALDKRQSVLITPMRFKEPAYTTARAQADAKKIQATLSTPLSFKAGSSTFKVSAQDIGSWYIASGATYTLNDVAIANYILEASVKAGVRPQNLDDITAKVKKAVSSRKALTASLIPYNATKTYRYCLGLREVGESHRKELAAAAQSAFLDVRGWGLKGQVVFEQVDSQTGSCDFTLWLSRADLMPTFGAICDAEWSCRVGNDVVVNFTRWQETSPAWKQYGGSVDDYRKMAINHETGHWFGFDHSTCPTPGQPAPVMTQQSISLGGCTFNPWPSARELAVYRSVIGL